MPEQVPPGLANEYEDIVMLGQHRHLANKYEDIVNLQGRHVVVAARLQLVIDVHGVQRGYSSTCLTVCLTK